MGPELGCQVGLVARGRGLEEFGTDHQECRLAGGAVEKRVVCRVQSVPDVASDAGRQTDHFSDPLWSRTTVEAADEALASEAGVLSDDEH